MSGHVASYGDKRHAVEICVCYARDKVGRPRTGRRDDDADFAGRFGVTLCGVRRALFVRREHARYFRFFIQFVEQVYYLSAGVTEYGCGVLFEQTFDNRRRAFDFH